MGISDQYCPCGVPLWEGEDYCRNCGQDNEWDGVCPNCDEKLDDPDICGFCRWEPGDDLTEPTAESDELREDRIVTSQHDAKAKYNRLLLYQLILHLGNGMVLWIPDMAVQRADFGSNEAYRKQRRKVAALIRSHVRKLVDGGTLPPDHKVSIRWSSWDDVPNVSLDPPFHGKRARAILDEYEAAVKEDEANRPRLTRKGLRTEARRLKAAKKMAALKPRPEQSRNGPSRQGQPWLAKEEAELRNLVQSGHSVDEISKVLRRTPGAIKSRMQRLRGDEARALAERLRSLRQHTEAKKAKLALKAAKKAEKVAKDELALQQWEENRGLYLFLAIVLVVGFVILSCMEDPSEESNSAERQQEQTITYADLEETRTGLPVVVTPAP